LPCYIEYFKEYKNIKKKLNNSNTDTFYNKMALCVNLLFLSSLDIIFIIIKESVMQVIELCIALVVF